MVDNRTLIAAMTKQMHPDTEVSPLAEFLARCFDDRDKMKSTQEFWIGAFEAGLPTPPYTSWAKSAIVTKYNELYQIDEDATIKLFAKIIRWARSNGFTVNKEYTDYGDFKLIVNNGESDFWFTSDRTIMCKKVFVGTEVVPAKPAQPEQVVDKYDWECDKLSFLGVNIDS